MPTRHLRSGWRSLYGRAGLRIGGLRRRWQGRRRRRRPAAARLRGASRSPSESRSRSRATSPIRATRPMRGYELWADTVNAKGGVLGRKVQAEDRRRRVEPQPGGHQLPDLINRDKVDLTFGPFSTLLTAPAAAVANRYGYAFPEPAGGGPAVFKEKLGNVFFVQPAPVVNCGDPFVNWPRSRCRPTSARRPPPIRRSTTPSPRRSSIARAPSSRPMGSRPSSRPSIRPRPRTSRPSSRSTSPRSPTSSSRARSPTDAYAQVKAMVQLKYSPKYLFLSNGANSPTEFPTKVGEGQHERDLLLRRLVRRPEVVGQRAVRRRLPDEVRRRPDQIDPGSAEAYAGRSAHRGRRGEDQEARQQDDHLVAAHRARGRSSRAT